MGIFKAAQGSVSGVLADQWLEIYSCDSLPQGVLSMPAKKKVGEHSANTKGEENVISDGSTIIVNAGQCALSIDKGQVTGVYDTPGENIYHSDRSASIFHKGGVKGVLRQSWDRFGYGGVAAVYQVIVFLDMREHMANPFEFRTTINLTDRNTGMSFDATLLVSGLFSFSIVKPAVFYKKICGASAGTVYVKDIMPQVTAEFKAALRQAIAGICKDGVTAYELSGKADVIADGVAEQMNEEWTEARGFSITSAAIEGISLTKGDKNLLQSVQMAKALTDPKLAAATLTASQAMAMQYAAQHGGKREPIRVTFNNQSK